MTDITSAGQAESLVGVDLLGELRVLQIVGGAYNSIVFVLCIFLGLANPAALDRDRSAIHQPDVEKVLDNLRLRAFVERTAVVLDEGEM